MSLDLILVTKEYPSDSSRWLMVLLDIVLIAILPSVSKINWLIN